MMDFSSALKSIETSGPYSSLPHEVLNVSDRIGLSQNVPKNFVDSFVKNRVPERTFNNDVRFATYLLNEGSKGSKKSDVKFRKKRGDGLTSKERKKIFDISKDSIKYETFKKINKLWHSYIDSVMSEITSSNDHIKLLRADFHGAHFAVCASINTSLIGIKGFVIQETKNTFRLINDNDKILTVPKEGTIFAFEHNGVISKLNGSNIKINSYGRSKIRMKIKKYIDI